MSGYGNYGGGDGNVGYGGYGGGYDGNMTMDNGGGFMTSSQGSNGMSPIRDRTARVESLTPVTLRQIKDVTITPDDTFELDGRPVLKVNFVARILALEKKENFVSFELEDGTAVVRGSWWHDDWFDPSTKFEQGMMVKGFGVMKKFRESINLTILKLDAIEDHNQITHHFLNSILTHHQVKHGNINPALRPIDGSMVSASGSNPAAQTNDFNAPHAHNAQFNAPPSMGQSISASNGNNAGSSIMAELNKLFSSREVEEKEMGISIEESHAEMLRRNHPCSANEVRQAIMTLSSEGHLYSTIDDQHYKSTDPCGF